MDAHERRRQRLARIIDLAQTYRGWTRRELAKALRRDPTKLVPASGVPKLDLVIDLATVLDWTVEDVVSFFWNGPEGESNGEPPAGDFELLDEMMREAHREGRYTLMVDLSRQGFDIAEDAEQRARACNREAGGWDGLGRFQNSLKAVQQGLRQAPVPGPYRRMLQSNLANAYYSLWSLVEARAIAGDLIAWYEECPADSLRDRKTLAFARYVAGHACRRLMTVEEDRRDFFARAAVRELTASMEAYEAIADEVRDGSFRGIADTCRGGLLEPRVTLGQLDPRDALDMVTVRLGEADDDARGDRLESVGWWCIFGCNIALRHLTDERELQSHMAVFTNKADEVAERLDSWTIRERVFTMEHTRWERAVGCTGFDIPCVVDHDDVRIITGTMARFPTFRETGWKILNSARVVGEDLD